MTEITISLSDERLQRLQELADQTGATPQQLLQAGLEDWLDRPQDDFASAAGYVLRKNAELYRRLS